MKLNDPITTRVFEIEHKYGDIFGRVESAASSVGVAESRCTDRVNIFVTGFSSNYTELEDKVYECLPYYDAEEIWLGKFPGIPTDDILVELMFWNLDINPEKYINNN